MNAATIISDALGMEQETADDFYTSAEMYVWLNNGLLEFIDKSGIYKQRFTIAMVENQTDYAYPTGLIRPEKAFFGTDMTEMEAVDVAKLSVALSGWKADAAGTPEYYYEELPGYISVYPKPNSANAGKLITLIGVSEHATVSSGSTTISIASQYHPALIEYLLYRMKTKDDRQKEASVHYDLFRRAILDARTDARQANRKDKRYSIFPSKIIKT